MLSLSSLTANLTFTTPAEFPYWMGSTFRGGFGIYLRKAGCPDIKRDCLKCEEREECIFYHTHMRESSSYGHSAPPKPLVITPPFFGKTISVEKGYLDINILLFGKFIRYLPHTLLGLRLLGQAGIGSKRRYNMNQFSIPVINCNFSGEVVCDGHTINLENMTIIDIADIKPVHVTHSLTIKFKTPFIAKNDFPPSFERLLWYIRQRTIHYVNEYGDGSQIPDFRAKGEITDSTQHFHKLKRRSQRGGKQEFHGYTGIVKYRVDEMDETARWLLGVGEVMGAGPKASFGCGHFNLSIPYQQS